MGSSTGVCLTFHKILANETTTKPYSFEKAHWMNSFGGLITRHTPVRNGWLNFEEMHFDHALRPWRPEIKHMTVSTALRTLDVFKDTFNRMDWRPGHS